MQNQLTSTQASDGPDCNQLTSTQIEPTIVTKLEKGQINDIEQRNSRVGRDRELHRIASERISKKYDTTHKQEAASKARTDELSSTSVGPKRTQAPQLESEASKAKQAQQLDLQTLQRPQTPKQLAIYINGKIRSNSIFCRSTPSSPYVSGQQSGNLSKESNISSLCKGSQQTPNQACSLDSNGKSRCEQSELGSNGITSSRGKNLNLSKLNPLLSGAREFLLNRRVHFHRKRRKLANSATEDEQDRASQQHNQKQDNKRQKGQQSDKASEAAAAATTTPEVPTTTTTTSYKLNPSSMFLRKAMRYYRLWIYCTNITILMGTILFIFATIYVLSDYRIKLLVSYQGSSSKSYHLQPTKANSNQSTVPINLVNTQPDSSKHRINTNLEHDVFISHSEPTIVIAYIAIAIQAGLLQAIGCFGAVRMKERWIQAFWLLILALTIFDIIFLFYWINRVDQISKSLRTQLTTRLYQNYGNNVQIDHLEHRQLDRRLEVQFDKTLTVSIRAKNTRSRHYTRLIIRDQIF